MKRSQKLDTIEGISNNIREGAEKALAKFKERLESDPVYAFEWGDAAYIAAARLTEARHIADGIAAVREGRNKLEEIVPTIDRLFAGDLVTRMGGTTSDSSNLMAKAQAVVAGKWLSGEFESSRRTIENIVKLTEEPEEAEDSQILELTGEAEDN